MSMSCLKTPFVVFGPSKSGTTWLQKLIDAHPEARCHFQIEVVPMVGDVRESILSPVRPVANFGKDPFAGMIAGGERGSRVYYARNALLRTLSREFDEFMRTRGEDLDEHARLELERQVFAGLSSSFLGLDDDTVRVVGTKAYTDLDRYFRVYPAGKVIAIVRNGRDVVVSKRHHMRNYGVYYHGDERSAWRRLANRVPPVRRLLSYLGVRHGLDSERAYRQEPAANNPHGDFPPEFVEKVATEWSLTCGYILRHQTARPEQVMVIRYEDLRADAAATAAAVFAFLGVETGASAVEEALAATSFAKLKKQSSSFFRSGKAGSGKRDFSPANEEVFQRYAGGMMSTLAYA